MGDSYRLVSFVSRLIFGFLFPTLAKQLPRQTDRGGRDKCFFNPSRARQLFGAAVLKQKNSCHPPGCLFG
jgi:hypothetical protein